MRSDVDLVMFLSGRVASNDGAPVPSDALVERVCNGRVRQQVYVSPGGDFTMQMGTQATLVDASGDTGTDWPSQQGVANRDLNMGIPRSDLTNCELRASVAGFHSDAVSLVDRIPTSGMIDVGAILVQRAAPVKGATLSATPYKAPPPARKAYERGADAEKKDKLAEAEKYFAKAVEIYPRYASAWYQLGTVFEKENQKDSARDAYAKAMAIEPRFLAPYRSLASLACAAGDWPEVLRLTDYILEHDPLSRTNAKEYVLDLDEANPAEIYFYNALANFKLGKTEEAEKSARRAEHVDLRSQIPQLHLLLAEISSRKKDYAAAISELEAYLELAPHAENREQVRGQLAKLEQLQRVSP
ncbi:MAG TPA: tetratricopeptide repeat protein [Terriglobales bacterium]|nr:tetratricopeptide repeat protein [Terriglobales bacterium]